MGEDVRELLFNALCHASKPCLCFVPYKTEARELAEWLQARPGGASDSGWRVEWVTGALSPEARAETAQRLREGQLDVVFCTDAWSDGVNIPNLRTVVLYAGGSSPRQLLQRIGRGARVTEGKCTFEVYDVCRGGVDRRVQFERLKLLREEGIQVTSFRPRATAATANAGDVAELQRARDPLSPRRQRSGAEEMQHTLVVYILVLLTVGFLLAFAITGAAKIVDMISGTFSG